MQSERLLTEAVFLFCADAATGPDGRLNIHGVFNELYAADFPARQDRIVLAGVVEWHRDAQGRIPFNMDLAGPDGMSVFTIDGHTDVAPKPDGRAPAKTQFILPLTKVMFPVPGRYRMRMEVDDSELTGPSIYLMRK
ncbi:MAG: hypothetical protein ACE5OQ_03945 [Woeseia sp.]